MIYCGLLIIIISLECLWLQKPNCQLVCEGEYRFSAKRAGFWKRTKYLLKTKKRALLVTIICVELILFTGLRGRTVGSDIPGYLSALNHYRDISFKEVFTKPIVYPFDYEIGYFVLSKFCSWAGIGEVGYLTIITCLIYVPLCIYIYRSSKNILLTVFCLFGLEYFILSMSAIRQMIAVAFVIFGLQYVKDRCLWKYLLVIGLAMLFHFAAIIVLPIYFLYKIDLRKLYFWIMILQILILFVGRYILVLIIELALPQYLGYIGGRYDVTGGSYLYLLLLNAVFVFYWVMTYSKKLTNEQRIILAQLVMGIMMQCFGYHMAVAGRLVYFFSISMIVAIPNAVEDIKEMKPLNRVKSKTVKALPALAVAGFMLFMFVYIASKNSARVFPFYFFWA